MSLALILWIALLAGAIALAAWVLEANRWRLRAKKRASSNVGTDTVASLKIVRPEDGRWHDLLVRMSAAAPNVLRAADGTGRLVRAGFDSKLAPGIYAFIRAVSAIGIPLIVVVWGAHDTAENFTIGLAAAVGVGLLAPRLGLDMLERRRQKIIRQSLPDALDLLLVCVEAGTSLDAAVLRVGREMGALHPELAEELLNLNRRTNAGVPREDALRGLYERTGVEELRALSSTLVQSERWGTSIGTVLRLSSETLRRKRRQSAEKRAAVAASKMVFPLALLILPALFIVLAGPIFLALGPIFDTATGR